MSSDDEFVEESLQDSLAIDIADAADQKADHDGDDTGATKTKKTKKTKKVSNPNLSFLLSPYICYIHDITCTDN